MDEQQRTELALSRGLHCDDDSDILEEITINVSTPDGIEFDREGYLDYRLRSVIREMIDQYGRRKTEFILMARFEEEAKEIRS